MSSTASKSRVTLTFDLLAAKLTFIRFTTYTAMFHNIQGGPKTFDCSHR